MIATGKAHQNSASEFELEMGRLEASNSAATSWSSNDAGGGNFHVAKRRRHLAYA